MHKLVSGRAFQKPNTALTKKKRSKRAKNWFAFEIKAALQDIPLGLSARPLLFARSALNCRMCCAT